MKISKTQNKIAGGPKTTARSFEVGYATPQQRQCPAPASTAAAQYLQVGFALSRIRISGRSLDRPKMDGKLVVDFVLSVSAKSLFVCATAFGRD
jgi:hypothetical protein